MMKIYPTPHSLRHILAGALCISGLAVPSVTAAAGTEPMMTLTSNGYASAGDLNAFTVFLSTTEPTFIDVDCGYGPVEVEVVPSMEGTPIPLSVGPEGVVRFYGDPALVDYMYCQGGYLTHADLSRLVNLDILDLSHNELAALDLSANVNLQALTLTDNPFDESPLIVGPKPGLVLMDLDITGPIDPSFNLSDYPEIQSFTAWSSTGLTSLDPTGCPKLQRLSVDGTMVRELDVTRNAALNILNISDTPITEIDLSGNPRLQQLYMTKGSERGSQFPFTSIDLSHNPQLVYLFASYNALTEIDLSGNPNIQQVYVQNNRLGGIDISANKFISALDLNQNCMDYATLPLPSASVSDYMYQQRAMPVDRSYATGMTLDLSERVLREGGTTRMFLYAVNREDPGNPEVLPDYFYEYLDGKVTFLREYTDSVYCSFVNDLFPDCVLHTTNFRIKSPDEYGIPTRAVSFSIDSQLQGGEIAFSVGLAGASAASPRTVWIDFGDQELKEYTVTDSDPAEPNIRGIVSGYSPIAVYVAENDDLYALKAEDFTITNINLDQAVTLRVLELANTGLYSIDMKWLNRLERLRLTGNHFYSVDLSAASGMYEKHMLSDVDLSDNGMQSVTLSSTKALRRLNLSGNRLTSVPLDGAYYITDLDVSDNMLSEFPETEYLDCIDRLDISGNLLDSFVKPEMGNKPSVFDCSRNRFTFVNLPYAADEIDGYVYAPQTPVRVGTRAPGADLSALDVEIDGNRTVYTWVNASGEPLAEGTDYTVTDGYTRFLDYDLGTVHCEMTNAAYPGFSGANALATTDLLVSAPPTNVLATLRVRPLGEAPATVTMTGDCAETSAFIDWNGDGMVYQDYMLTDMYSIFPVSYKGSGEVKVYTYEDHDNVTVFSTTNVPVEAADFSAMDNLICLGLHGAGLTDSDIESLRLPLTERLTELGLSGNNLTCADFSSLPALAMLDLSDNMLTGRIDFSPMKRLQQIFAPYNTITEARFDNPDVWSVMLSHNRLSTFSSEGLPALHQVALDDNLLTEIDIDPSPVLRVLMVTDNRMTFQTLPPVKEDYAIYYYGNQAPLEPECIDGVVDLSSQYDVRGTITEYVWVHDVPYLDENGELAGDFLTPGEDYTVEGGVTTFNGRFADVCCVMTNALYPDLFMLTTLMNVDKGDGVETVIGDSASFAVRDGRIVISAPAGLEYCVASADGRVVLSGVTDGTAAVTGQLQPGVYVARAGKAAMRVMVR